MTVYQLLHSMGSYELAEWEAFFKESNRPQEQKPEVLASQLKNVFAAHKQKKGKKK